jgi:hypothetical protein
MSESIDALVQKKIEKKDKSIPKKIEKLTATQKTPPTPPPPPPKKK